MRCDGTPAQTEFTLLCLSIFVVGATRVFRTR